MKNHMKAEKFIEMYLEEVDTSETRELTKNIVSGYEDGRPTKPKTYQPKEGTELEMYLYTYQEQFVIRSKSNSIDFTCVYAKSIKYESKEKGDWKRFTYRGKNNKDTIIFIKLNKMKYFCNYNTPFSRPFYKLVIKGHVKDVLNENNLSLNDMGLDIITDNIWESVELSDDKNSFLSSIHKNAPGHLNSIKCAINFIEYCECLTDYSFILKHYSHISPIEDIVRSNPTIYKVCTNDNFIDPFNVIHVEANINLDIRKEDVQNTILKNRDNVINYLINAMCADNDIKKYRDKLKCDLLLIDNYKLIATFGFIGDNKEI